jgi:hypothetical protein
MMHGTGDGTSRPATQKELPALNGLYLSPPFTLYYTHERLCSACALVGLPLSRLNLCVICRDLVEQV